MGGARVFHCCRSIFVRIQKQLPQQLQNRTMKASAAAIRKRSWTFACRKTS